MNSLKNIIVGILLISIFVGGQVTNAQAGNGSPTSVAENIRSALFNTQMSLSADNELAWHEFSSAKNLYLSVLGVEFKALLSDLDERIIQYFVRMETALENDDPVEFSLVRAKAWTAILEGSIQVVEQAIENEDLHKAQTWYQVREYRTATRFSRLRTDGTLALQEWGEEKLSADEAMEYLYADLFDTYQARLNESLRSIQSVSDRSYKMQLAEQVGLASGYFSILAPVYEAQRGSDALVSLKTQFDQLESAVTSNAPVDSIVEEIVLSLDNFKAAPLSPFEQSRRAGQLLRYVNLVAVEYGRGVSNGQVTKQFEIQEAVTFFEAAQSAFDDLKDLLVEESPENTVLVERDFDILGNMLAKTNANGTVASSEDLRRVIIQIEENLKATMPEDWQKGSTSGDFEVIESMLTQMETAIRADDYEMAESSRLEAYAILESGPEARLSILAPESKVVIEDLFWNGQGEEKGLAYLIEHRAPLSEIRKTRLSLRNELKSVEELLSVESAPAAVIGNAGVIVFREGLEAVVILASLMGSMKAAEKRKYRQPMWVGTGLALVATALTWVLARTVLTSLARYGEKLEAVVSLIAIAILLLITNWFFHKTYWTNWIASFQSKKKRLFSGEAGLVLGLVSLGFTSVYREGFETVLFLQALVLESGTGLVLSGVSIGLLATILVGVITFKLQTRLPYMKMLVITGILIGAVLLIIVGKTVHVLQVVGWMPTSLIGGATFPFWLGTWFGTYPTWQGVILQVAAAIFVIGSYYLAEGMRKGRKKTSRSKKMVEAR